MAELTAKLSETRGTPLKFKQGTAARLRSSIKKAVENSLTPQQIFTHYVDISTLHGINYACENTALLRRLFWSCCMIAGAIYFVDKLQKGIEEYLSYPFSTLSTLEYVEKLTFPAISLCLVNSYNFTQLEASKLKASHDRHAMLLEKRNKDPNVDISGEKLNESLHEVSIPIENIFLDCEWIARDTRDPSVNKTLCGTMNFTHYFNELSQRCFTFNPGKDGHRLLSVDHPGLSYAYELKIDLKSDEAVSTEDYGGMMVVLHDQSHPPVMSNGFLLAPGFSTYVRMSKIENQGLPPPYATNCGHKTLKFYKEYSQKACLLEMFTDYAGKVCKCRAIFMPDNGLPICSINQVFHCVHPAKESFKHNEKRIHCPIECNEVSFDHRLNAARYRYIPKKLSLGGNFQNLSSKEKQRYIEKNIINVFFYYGEMTEEMHEQEGSLDFYQFLGDMGGEIGLMLGASILSFVEIIDLFIFLLYNVILRLHKGRTSNKYADAISKQINFYKEKEKEPEEVEEVVNGTSTPLIKYKDKDENDFQDLFSSLTSNHEHCYDEFGDRITTL